MQSRAGLLLALVALTVAVWAPGAAGIPTRITIVLDGGSTGQGPIRGTFVATGLLCPSGTFSDGTAAPTGERVRVKRVLTCADGSGEIVAVYDGVTENRDGPGTWKVFSGSGKFESLRGKGTTSNDSLTYDPTRGGTFRNTWEGVGDFDRVAPTVKVTRLTATRLGPPRTYAVRVAFSAEDNVRENAVAYTLSLFGPQRLAARAGVAASGTTSMTLRIRASRAAERIEVELTATDPLDNSRTVRRSVKLPRG